VTGPNRVLFCFS